MDIKKQVEEAVKDLPSDDYMLGRGLAQPFNPANSGSRKLMFSTHREHLMVLNNGEVPIIQTGFEDEFGRNSSSYIEAESDYLVIYKIPKYSLMPDDHYFLIIQDINTGIYDVLERVEYKHNTESYGYLYNNNYLDRLQPQSRIRTGDIIKTSNGFDEFGNRLDGVNLTTMYLASAQNMEDSIIISESARKKLSTVLINTPSITINDNDILLNLYGDEGRYKAFPDIGEEVKNNIFCGIRRLENENILYSLSQSKLRDIFTSDKKIILSGRVVDINVYCNNPESLKESYYNQQLYYYYQENIKFCTAINDLVGPLAMNGELSYDLQKLYARCRDTIGGKQFFKDKIFNNVIMEATIVETLGINKGDKMTDRYGGKGIISKIVPDELMPRLDNGNVVEVIKNQSTCINRENLGQLNEQSLTFMGSRMLDFFDMGTLSYTEMAEIIYRFIYFVNPEQAEYYISAIDLYDEEQAMYFVESMVEDGCGAIRLSLLPFTQNITIDTLNEMYKEFPWIKPYKISVPIRDSNGNIRYVDARRPMIVGKIYNYRLKQYAEEKFSVTSLSATNLKNLNTKSKANKMYETKYAKTPIMFGPMESGDLAHLGMHYVVMNLMLYSSSPQGRRLFEQLLTGDPYDIDIKLDKDSKNRNAEIINTILKAMGLRLEFIKVPKVRKQLARIVMCKSVENKDFKYKTNIRDIIGHDDELRIKYNIARRNMQNNDSLKPLALTVMAKKVEKPEEEQSKETEPEERIDSDEKL